MAGFMQMQLWRERGIEVYDPDDTSNIITLPESYTEDCARVEGAKPTELLWWAEYSAPGYLDRTDPVSGTTALEAVDECYRMYAACDGDCDEGAECAECIEYDTMRDKAEQADKEGAK